MQNIFDKLDEGILIIDKRGKIELCNDKLISKLGYKKLELNNLNIKKIIYGKEDIIIDEILNCDKDKNGTIQLYSKHKDLISFNYSITFTEYKNKDMLFIICKEINDKAYNLEDLEDFLDNIEMSAWIKNINGKYIYANRCYANLAEKSKEYIMGKYDKDIWEDTQYKKYYKTYIESDNDIIKYKRAMLFEEKSCADKEERIFESYKAPILDEDKNIKNIIGLTRDVTLQKKINQEFNKMNIIKNLINTKNYDLDIQKSLESICGYFLKHLNADGLSIISYDSTKKELIPCLELGCSNKLFSNLKFIKINNKEEFDLLNNKRDCIIKVDEIEGIEDYKKVLDKEIEYLGVYNIKLKDEFMGIINIAYKSGNNPRFNQDDFIKYTCSQIATIIKNHRLSQQVKTENKRRVKIEEELELFLETAVDLMGIIGIDGCFKKTTSKWTEILGWSEEELKSTKITNLLHPDDFTYNINEILVKELPKGKIRSKNRYLCKNGEYIWIDCTSRYIEEDNNFIVTGRDITKEKLMEDQQKKLEETIQLEGIKNEFFANISHEFKTPLNIILGSMQLLNQNIQQDNVTTEKLIKNVSTIKQNSYRLLRLVNNLIDMSRIDTGYYELQISNHNIVNIIEDISLSVVNYVEGKNINLIFDTNTEEEIVACDPDKIERIVLNILSNAIKYTDEKGEIIVSLKSENKKIIVSIRDNGVGIPEDKLGIIFDRFRQVNSNLVRRCEGSGIGLSLVKSLVEMHGGSIRVKSEVGNGTEFIFELPICKIEDESEIILQRDEPHNQIEKCNIEFSDIYSS
ncbi:MAG: ATP-binding protein [Romboutsia sp.]|uniref:ATP-binding protein n=1 Tax=Romboutsia sp. TaxID=1965302 RepID=UPI003F419573